jgi:hypothetical protein
VKGSRSCDVLAEHLVSLLREQYLKQVLLSVGCMYFGGTDLAERGDEGLHALVVLLVRNAVRRREFE